MTFLNPPSSAARVDVPEASVDRYLAQGWRKAGAPAPAQDDGAPPKAGAGSSRQAWADYAATLGVAVPDEWTRDDIIDAVEG
jgi:hypothetical protein